MLKMKGNEKFWAALLGGGSVTFVTTIVLMALSASVTGIPAPTPDIIVGAFTGMVATLFAAASAWVATNSAPDEPVIEENIVEG